MSSEASAQTATKSGRYRWSIVALLFFATTVNYIDRTMLGLLAPSLEKELGWNENDYGNIVTAFQAAYAMGFLLMGWLIDRFGPKIGYGIAICIWTVGHVAHGFAGVGNLIHGSARCAGRRRSRALAVGRSRQ